MGKSEKVVPCPKCNNKEHIYIRHKDIMGITKIYTVACLKCKISSDFTISEDDAISAWNEQVDNGKTVKIRKYDENNWWNERVCGTEENHG